MSEILKEKIESITDEIRVMADDVKEISENLEKNYNRLQDRQKRLSGLIEFQKMLMTLEQPKDQTSEIMQSIKSLREEVRAANGAWETEGMPGKQE